MHLQALILLPTNKSQIKSYYCINIQQLYSLNYRIKMALKFDIVSNSDAILNVLKNFNFSEFIFSELFFMLGSILKEVEPYAEQIGIISSDGTIIMKTKVFEFTANELDEISTFFTMPEKKMGTTIRFRNEDYIVINHSMKHFIAVRSYVGIIGIRCEKSFIIAYHNESHETSICFNAISKLASMYQSIEQQNK